MPARGGRTGERDRVGNGELGGSADGGDRRAGMGRRRRAGGHGAGRAQRPPAQPALAPRRAALRCGAGGGRRARRTARGCDACDRVTGAQGGAARRGAAAGGAGLCQPGLAGSLPAVTARPLRGRHRLPPRRGRDGAGPGAAAVPAGAGPGRGPLGPGQGGPGRWCRAYARLRPGWSPASRPGAGGDPDGGPQLRALRRLAGAPPDRPADGAHARREPHPGGRRRRRGGGRFRGPGPRRGRGVVGLAGLRPLEGERRRRSAPGSGVGSGRRRAGPLRPGAGPSRRESSWACWGCWCRPAWALWWLWPSWAAGGPRWRG